MKEQVQKLSHIEHILRRPDSYVGEVQPVTEPFWVVVDSGLKQQNVTYSPALLKIFDEILVNAIDRNSLFPKECTRIQVLCDDTTISVTNNGPLGGISVQKHPQENIWNPELTFGHLLTSTNYDDDKNRVVGGRNGYGAKLANVYSKVFVVTICDHVNKLKYVQRWEENMTTCNPPKITKYTGAQSSVQVAFQPDTKRLKMSSDFGKIIEKRVHDANICTSKNCKVTFQGAVLPKLTLEKYAQMHLDSDVKVVSHSNERWDVSVAVSDKGFQHVSFVNGICTTKGGTHVDHVVQQIAKQANLSVTQLRNTLFVFVKSTLVNPTFSSQVKSECTLKSQKFGSSFVPTATFVKAMLKAGVQDELNALNKLKELRELKRTDGNAKRSKISGIPKLEDANCAGTAKGKRCTLIVTEGDSAKTLAVAGFSVVGRDYYGVYPIRGKFRNVRDLSVKQLMSNQEFNDLKKILGLQQGREYSSLSELRYGRLMIMTDADVDGSHIKGLLLNMIESFWPSLLKLGFVVSMVTPIIKATKGTQEKMFFTEAAFRDWWKDTSGWRIKYYKGLGTSTSKEAKEYFSNIDKLTVRFNQDDKSQDALVLAFDKKKADDRKSWLVNSSKNTPDEVKYGVIRALDIHDFIHQDMINFSLADTRRSIAHVCDGLKPSQRKVIYACLQRNLTQEMKVAQLAAYVSEKTAYHHGEVSLADTIVKLAHDYMGSNNMNLLEPCGQFGTRLMGGKDASQTRYIFTRLMPYARRLFDPRDDSVLKYLQDDGKSIEPEYFVPVLPTVLINGTEGIGTGFSSSIPPYNPSDIKENIRRLLDSEKPLEMKPWFRNFKGTVTDADGQWVAVGVFRNNRVTELPPGRWTQDYKEFLETLVEKNVISDFKNNSTTESVDFEIYGYDGTDPIKDLKLSKTIHTTNMHLFHPKEGIKKYATPQEILMDFLEIRMRYYKLRKQHMIQELSRTNDILTHKARFVKMVVDGKVIVFKKKKSVLEEELKAMGFPETDYLLDIKTYQYTHEAIAKLLEDAKRAKEDLEKLKNTSIVDMCKEDILKCSVIPDGAR